MASSDKAFIVGDPLGGARSPTELVTGDPQAPYRLSPFYNGGRLQVQRLRKPVPPTSAASPSLKTATGQRTASYAPTGAPGGTGGIGDTRDIENVYQALDRWTNHGKSGGGGGGAKKTVLPTTAAARGSAAYAWLATRLSLVSFVLLALALLVALQALAWAFVKWGLPESFKDDVLVDRLLGALDIAIGFLYITWFVGIERGFVAPHTRFTTLCARIKTLENHTFNIVLGHAATSETPDVVRRAALDTYHLFVVMYVYAYRMFTRHDPTLALDQLVPPTSSASRRLAASLLLSTHPFAVFNGALALYELTLYELERQLRLSVGVRDNTRCIDEALRRIHELTEEADVAARVRTPWLLRDHLGVILGAFFLVLSPIGCAIRFDLASLVIYPLVTFLLLGTYVYIKFLGDPFLSMPEFTDMNPLLWRDERLSEIAVRYAHWSAGAPPPPVSSSPSASQESASRRASTLPTVSAMSATHQQRFGSGGTLSALSSSSSSATDNWTHSAIAGIGNSDGVDHADHHYIGELHRAGAGNAYASSGGAHVSINFGGSAHNHVT